MFFYCEGFEDDAAGAVHNVGVSWICETGASAQVIVEGFRAGDGE